ncbi:hypothetical protein SNEBB_002920 [Seison nebaliae]|nr:hypothetical protein SNEBB_002920 [Seison nebaliae]
MDNRNKDDLNSRYPLMDESFRSNRFNTRNNNANRHQSQPPLNNTLTGMSFTDAEQRKLTKSTSSLEEKSILIDSWLNEQHRVASEDISSMPTDADGFPNPLPDRQPSRKAELVDSTLPLGSSAALSPERVPTPDIVKYCFEMDDVTEEMLNEAIVKLELVLQNPPDGEYDNKGKIRDKILYQSLRLFTDSDENSSLVTRSDDKNLKVSQHRPLSRKMKDINRIFDIDTTRNSCCNVFNVFGKDATKDEDDDQNMYEEIEDNLGDSKNDEEDETIGEILDVNNEQQINPYEKLPLNRNNSSIEKSNREDEIRKRLKDNEKHILINAKGVRRRRHYRKHISPQMERSRTQNEKRKLRNKLNLTHSDLVDVEFHHERDIDGYYSSQEDDNENYNGIMTYSNAVLWTDPRMRNSMNQDKVEMFQLDCPSETKQTFQVVNNINNYLSPNYYQEMSENGKNLQRSDETLLNNLSSGRTSINTDKSTDTILKSPYSHIRQQKTNIEEMSHQSSEKAATINNAHSESSLIIRRTLENIAFTLPVEESTDLKSTIDSEERDVLSPLSSIKSPQSPTSPMSFSSGKNLSEVSSTSKYHSAGSEICYKDAKYCNCGQHERKVESEDERFPGFYSVDKESNRPHSPTDSYPYVNEIENEEDDAARTIQNYFRRRVEESKRRREEERERESQKIARDLIQTTIRDSSRRFDNAAKIVQRQMKRYVNKRRNERREKAARILQRNFKTYLLNSRRPEEISENKTNKSISDVNKEMMMMESHIKVNLHLNEQIISRQSFPNFNSGASSPISSTAYLNDNLMDGAVNENNELNERNLLLNESLISSKKISPVTLPFVLGSPYSSTQLSPSTQFSLQHPFPSNVSSHSFTPHIHTLPTLESNRIGTTESTSTSTTQFTLLTNTSSSSPKTINTSIFQPLSGTSETYSVGCESCSTTSLKTNDEHIIEDNSLSSLASFKSKENVSIDSPPTKTKFDLKHSTPINLDKYDTINSTFHTRRHVIELLQPMHRDSAYSDMSDSELSARIDLQTKYNQKLKDPLTTVSSYYAEHRSFATMTSDQSTTNHSSNDNNSNTLMNKQKFIHNTQNIPMESEGKSYANHLNRKDSFEKMTQCNFEYKNKSRYDEDDSIYENLSSYSSSNNETIEFLINKPASPKRLSQSSIRTAPTARYSSRPFREMVHRYGIPRLNLATTKSNIAPKRQKVDSRDWITPISPLATTIITKDIKTTNCTIPLNLEMEHQKESCKRKPEKSTQKRKHMRLPSSAYSSISSSAASNISSFSLVCRLKQKMEKAISHTETSSSTSSSSTYQEYIGCSTDEGECLDHSTRLADLVY